ncbi:MAG: prepilin-type N-terminal cleavage/methylation domain-containing protein [Gemmatimonadota bacterium]|nr:MAG: prepilin-type N-terminal cleavage/methylation domain-containing protein [Gemmatimonadota bacterium]
MRRIARGTCGHSIQGFTLLELIIGLVLGAVIISAAVAFLITHIRSLEGSDIRENVARNDRYIGALLRRDVQMAGIDVKSSTKYGTVVVSPGSNGDTLAVLYAPYEPYAAPIYEIHPATAVSPPDTGQGTCGTHCIDFYLDPADTSTIQPGDLARVQVDMARRLILISEVDVVASFLRVTFTSADTLLHQSAGLKDFMLKTPDGTTLQELRPIVYYLDDQERLIRAERLNMDGSPDGEIVAYGVEEFEVSVVFADGDELEQPNPVDSDDSNDYDDIVTVNVRVTVKAERADPRVNGGELLRKTSEWHISPRNLRYEKNRM